ncbi:C40 family peptidase [Streptomyces sp. 5-10]|uniref:C40 family peptidase n=1 Tax=Streptomyces sp. 5-10 TaxID=878925 RepID=UPI00168BD9E8|nr:C40 family peptidase [Streptomyces sp. 5-10]MBD3004857.1 C40 family peptidase [Streptomyces sp. 5-10]
MNTRVKKTATFVSAMTATFATLANPANAEPEGRVIQDHPAFEGFSPGDIARVAVSVQAENMQEQIRVNELLRLREAAEKTAARKARENRIEAEAAEAAKRNPLRVVEAREGLAPRNGTAWATALNWAQTKLGLPYVWGGESDAEGGYDCSGLTKAAYSRAGVALPRTAQDQYFASGVHPSQDQLRPGDLVFYGTPGNIHHVGMYTGGGMMLHAPNSRSLIRFDRIDYMGDYFGATRVA